MLNTPVPSSLLQPRPVSVISANIGPVPDIHLRLKAFPTFQAPPEACQLGLVKKYLRDVAVGMLTHAKARRVRILDEDVRDEQRRHGTKAPGHIDAGIS